MNFNIELYDKAEAKEFGDFERLELGGHEIVIMDAREYKSPITENLSLKVCVDIGGKDKQAGFFRRQFDENPNSDKKWSNGGTRYVSLKDDQIAYLKGFITACENSNPSFKFNTKGTWEQLKGLKLAGQFGLEEYKKQDGSIGTTTKLIQFRSIDKLGEIKVPDVKLIDGTYMDIDDYEETKASRTAEEMFGASIVETDNTPLPFEL